MLRDMLRQEGIEVGRKHVATLMRRMGIEALIRRKSTSRPAPGHQIYPYLLRNVAVDRPNQVWALDITYVPMRRGFVYFVAVMDWATRRILAHRLSNTLTADFCVDALDEAIMRYGAPEIVNTDQGSQFTGAEFIGKLEKHSAARESITRYVTFYNQRRPHRALNGATPDTAYFASRDLKAAA